MAIIQSDTIQSRKAFAYPPAAGLVVALRATHAFTTGQLVTGNIIEMLPIPVGCRLIDLIVDSDDLDNGGTAVQIDVGIMSGAFGDTAQDRTCDASIVAASTVAQAGGTVRPSLKTAFRTAAVQSERSIGLKVETQPTTPQAGTVGITALFATG